MGALGLGVPFLPLALVDGPEAVQPLVDGPAGPLAPKNGPSEILFNSFLILKPNSGWLKENFLLVVRRVSVSPPEGDLGGVEPRHAGSVGCLKGLWSVVGLVLLEFLAFFLRVTTIQGPKVSFCPFP